MTGQALDWYVRSAQPEDAASIARVLHAAYAEYSGQLEPPSGAHDETDQSVRAWFDTGGAGVAETSEGIVGVVHYAPLPSALYLGRLAVLPAWRSHGIGAALVRFVEDQARARRLERVTLGVRIQLPDNRSYYEALGYVVAALGTHSGYAAPTYYTMEKIITPLSQTAVNISS